MVGEAARLAGCAPHVSEPVTPRTLYGLGADELEQWCADLVATAGQQVDEKGRKQRKDTAIIMGVVASYPGPPDEGDPNYVRWKALNVAYFCEKFGPNVVSIVEHLDEKHGHLRAGVGRRALGQALASGLRGVGAVEAGRRHAGRPVGHTRPRRVRGRMSTRRRWRRLVGWLGLGLVGNV